MAIENYGADLIKIFFMLVLLIGFLLFTAWLVKRFVNTRMRIASQGKEIQVIERVPISPKSILYLIEVEGEKFLISESQVQIQKIDRLQQISSLENRK